MTPRLLVVAATRAELPRGMGGVTCGMRAMRLDGAALQECDAVLVTGTCGALVPGVAPGALVLCESVQDEVGSLAPDAAMVASLLRATSRCGLALLRAAFVQRDEVVDGRDERAALAEATGARFIDMETARIARAASAAGRPWAALRVVSDAPEATLAWLADLLGGMPSDEPSPARVALALLRRPSALPKLLALGRLVARGRADVGRVVEAMD